MRKIVLIFSLLITIVNFIILVIALTIDSSIFYNNRLVIMISFLTFGGFLRQQILSFNKKNFKKS
jgi:hypothetical protein